MIVKITIDEAKLFKEVVHNLPEHSISLQCTKYDYKNCRFEFFDSEDGKEYLMNIHNGLLGIQMLIHAILDKKLFFTGCGTLDEVLDPCCWDANVVDALIQFSLFSEVIYG